MEYSVIIFDTAPTGHTLRLLSFPSSLEAGLSKAVNLKSKMSSMFSQFSSMLMEDGDTEEQAASKLDLTKKIIDQVSEQFKNPDYTTFVCVCIPEFLSLYETERLLQELFKYGIDSHNIIINQVLEPEKDSKCPTCKARVRIQSKYIDDIYELYDDFHLTKLPLLPFEVRGVEAISNFSARLVGKANLEKEAEYAKRIEEKEASSSAQ
eukprot:TRINITY_DN1701_c0_g1_i2.p1 TRINITY_DN1701_c0_g1~~TRINITY_DN1701_c0_g1_i2.p1  ORF type:complete len:208 (-),score=54.32 TRINITY_DN1701_c0_g1_i2:48-671(-)